MAGALGDAVWMCGMERNSDVVLMECFAPLFVNVSQTTGGNRSMQWESDLIGYDAINSYGSPSYYVETMFGQNSGNAILAVKADGIPTISQTPPPGRGGTVPPAKKVPGLYYSATKDTASGTIYLKLVNVGDAPQPVNVSITGVKSVSAKGESLVLSADKADDTNSIKDPVKLVPVTEKIGGLGATFTQTLPKFSVTVLKLKTR
jgi:alpha-N-arabinofuranosidase